MNNCAICGAALGKTLLKITTPDRFEKYVGISEKSYVRKWVECSVCGAATDVRDPRYRNLLKKLETAYYAVDFKNSSLQEKYKKIMALPPEKSDNAQRVIRIHAFMDEWRKRYFPKGRGPFSVLDIGAGLGVFLARFLEQADTRSWRAVALDSDPLACSHLRSLKKFQVIQEMFPGKTVLREFDLCTLNKVVEHVSQPVAFLKKIKPVLSAERGVIYLELPDKITIFHRPPTDNILGTLHHHLYDPHSIIILLNRAGFLPLTVMRFFEPSGKISVAAFAALPSAVSRLAKEHFQA